MALSWFIIDLNSARWQARGKQGFYDPVKVQTVGWMREVYMSHQQSALWLSGVGTVSNHSNYQASEHLLPNQDWTLCQNKCWSYICGNYLKRATVSVLNLFSLLAVMPTTTGYWFRTKVSLMPINMHLKKQLDLLVRCSYFCCNYMSEKQRLHFIIQSFTSANVYFCL